MASDELKPCPFCGGNAETDTHTDACYFTVNAAFLERAGHNADLSLAPAVLRAWNRRAQDFDAMRQRVELLEGLLSTARDYVYSDLEERKAAMAGYPHKWQQEEADLAEIDAALAQQAKP